MTMLVPHADDLISELIQAKNEMYWPTSADLVAELHHLLAQVIEKCSLQNSIDLAV